VLVVRRRAGELIRIGDEVEVRLLSIGKTSVRLGIEAPRSIAIDMRQSETESGENNCGNGRYTETSGEA
jgi:carbon storage regulator